MKNIDTLLRSSSYNQNRRRRRATPPAASYGIEDNNYLNPFHDENPDGDEKGHRRGEDRIFMDSSSFGQFFLNPCFCLTTDTKDCTKQKYGKSKKRSYLGSDGRKNLLLLLPSLVFVTITILLTSGTRLPAIHRLLLLSSSSPPGRPITDEDLYQILVKIPMFDFEFEERDIGGWKSMRRFFRPGVSLDLSMIPPDFGGLEMFMTQKPKAGARASIDNNSNSNDIFKNDPVLRNELLSPPRQINPDDASLELEYWIELRKDDPNRHSYDFYPEELEDRNDKCRNPNWAKRYLPSCNSIHELTLGEDYDAVRAKLPGYDQSFDSFYISHGAFRDVWVTHQPFPENEKSALKMTRYKRDWDHRTFFYTMNDAMVMERLTGSPRIVDIYGHCGGSVWVEAMPHEMEEIIIPGEGMVKPEDLPEELESRNVYTVEEKLDIALFMAESLADLHGFSDGVIVHDDVQLCQWLRTSDGRLKLGDFNRAEVMQYNDKKGKYCYYYNGSCYGNYRAPEEYDKQYLNEKIDVFSFGNNIYGLLTGLWVFYDVDDDGTVQKEVIKGNRAFIDARWKERSYVEAKMVELLEKCWIADADDRIDIFEAVEQLREIKKEHEKRKFIYLDEGE